MGAISWQDMKFSACCTTQSSLRSLRWISRGLVWLVLSVTTASAVAQADISTYQRLNALTAATSLIYVERPWHLKIELMLYPKGSKTPENGSIERWQSGDDSRTIYTLGAASLTELSHSGHHFKTTQGDAIPDAVTATLAAVLHPGPYPTEMAGTSPELRQKNFGKTNADCIMLSRPMPKVALAPLGLFPTYCMVAGEHLAASYNYGSHTVVRSQVGRFLDHDITTGVSIMDGEQVIARGKVSELSTFTPKADEFDPSPELAGTIISAQVSGGVVAGQRIRGGAPIYPPSARQNRVSGAVVLQAVIGRDGHVQSLIPVSAPDPDLAISAIAAVKDWVYKPYLLNGEPVDINTTITVNYNLN